MGIWGGNVAKLSAELAAPWGMSQWSTWTLQQVAKLMDVATKTIRRWIIAYQIPTPGRRGRYFRFTRADLVAIVEGGVRDVGYWAPAATKRKPINKKQLVKKKQKTAARKRNEMSKAPETKSRAAKGGAK
jgi:hypothetical protein